MLQDDYFYKAKKAIGSNISKKKLRLTNYGQLKLKKI